MEEENESDHFEPIRMRLMADEMFQLTFQIENLDQILENLRVCNILLIVRTMRNIFQK